MAKCDVCGEDEAMPYQCRLCGGTHCSEHRLPENHDCPGLEEWNDPGGVFDSGFDDSVRHEGGRSRSAGERIADAVGIDTGPGGVLAYFRRNMTFVFLGVMWVMFLVQHGIAPFLVDRATWYNLFTLNTAHPEYVWTWVTSVFAHGGLWHIALNSIVLYFFGPVVEKRIGSKKFAALFLASGMLAGLAQVSAQVALHPGVLGEPVFPPYVTPNAAAVLGASGAIAAVMGVLTVLNPNLRIYLYFIIPMPLWIATALFAGFAVLSSTVGGIGAGGVAQVAHLAGLALGVAYGLRLKRAGKGAPSQLQFGGRRGPGGPGGPGGRF
ncbi:MAG: rhomboid family intramembrane serine protease [Halobacteriaceae archaeon]